MNQLDRRGAIKAVAGLAAWGSCGTAAEPDKPRIVRLTVVGNTAYAPTEEGDWIEKDYPKEGPGTGKLEAIAYPNLAKDESSFRRYLTGSIRDKAAGLRDGPVVIMVHGFMADPREKIDPKRPQSGNNPHTFSFHFSGAAQRHWRHTASWPRGLGLGLATPKTEKPGLPIAFAWNSMPDLFTDFKNTLEAKFNKLSAKDKKDIFISFGIILTSVPDIVSVLKEFNAPLEPEAYRKLLARLDKLLCDVEKPLANVADKLPEVYREPYDRAEQAAWALANTIRVTAQTLPNKPIDLFCHSLGSRVVTRALYHMAEKEVKELEQVGRVIIVGGAEYSVRAQAMLAAVRKRPGGGPFFYNFMARRDRVLAVLAQRFHPIKSEPNEPKLDRTVGMFGLDTEKHDPRWIDLQLDKDVAGKNPLDEWLKPQNLSVAGTHPLGILNHWHYFTSEGNMALYRAILHDRADWTIETLVKAGIPQREGREKMPTGDCTDQPR